MSSKVDPFSVSEIESLARALGDAATGSELTTLLRDSNMDDPQSISLQGVSMTKWHRVDHALRVLHNRDQSANGILAFTKRVHAPSRFVNKSPREHEDALAKVNRVLALKGINLRDDGELVHVPKSATVHEAQQRADRLRSELERRAVHLEVLRFCRTELMDKDYFHAVLEATKSLADKIRSLSGSKLDGSPLIDEALQTSQPVLLWNGLQTQSERSEHMGIAAMHKGIFSYFRNPTAHEPRILKPISEDEALEALTMISFLHRRLDSAQVVRQIP